MARSFLESGEYLASFAGLDNAAFVDLLYDTVLERAPEIGGAAFWADALDRGLAREDALLAFSESLEHIEKTEAALAFGVFLEDYLVT